jgi:DnaA family protein
VRQLPLDLSARPDAKFGNFLAGGNAEALQAVRSLAAGTLAEAVVYLWGGRGSGRTHLLLAAARENPALTVADDVETLDPDAQQVLFVAINEAREGRAAVLAAGNAPPAQLRLRDDLRTRLAWGLVYQLQPLTDAEKKAHLQAAARERGLVLADEVATYLLSRLPRDLASLQDMLDRLDRVSLAKQRPLTVPLVREALADPASGELVPRQREGG